MAFIVFLPNDFFFKKSRWNRHYRITIKAGICGPLVTFSTLKLLPQNLLSLPATSNRLLSSLGIQPVKLPLDEPIVAPACRCNWHSKDLSSRASGTLLVCKVSPINDQILPKHKGPHDSCNTLIFSRAAIGAVWHCLLAST